MKQPVLLRIYRGDKLVAIKQFTEPQIAIGRNADVLLELDDEAVTPLHCLIEERDNGYYVVDLGSLSGTLCNGQPVLDHKLSAGDELTIGPFRIEFFIGVPKPTKAPPLVVVTPPPSVTAPSAANVVKQPTEFPPAKKSVDSGSQESTRASGPKSFEPAPPPKRGQDIPPAAPSVPSAPIVAAPPQAPAAPTAPIAKAKSSPAVTKSRGTFAPPSAVQDLREVIKPDKGTSIEIVVAWKERVVATQHYNFESRRVRIGAGVDNDIVIPLIGMAKPTHTLLDINQRVSVLLTPAMKGELIRDGKTESFSELQMQNRMSRVDGGFALPLQQGEMVRIVLEDGLVNIFVRFVPETAKPLLAPLLDLSATELTTLIGAMLLILSFGIYNALYAPDLEEEKILEPERIATVVFQRPRPPTPPEPPKPVPVQDQPPQQKSEKPAPNPQPLQAKDPGQAKKTEGRKSDQPKTPKKITSAQPGGALNTGAKGGSAQTVKPDPTSLGILSVFGKSGTQERINKAASGSDALIGMAETATGKVGDTESRPGDVGTRLKDTGAGGKGSATVNIDGVGTRGSGTGVTGTGSGGLGQRSKIDIQTGGAEEDFVGSIDREAVRRVILDNRNSFRSCYNDELRKDSSVFGKLVLRWVITEGGRVKSVSVQSSAFSAQMANCIGNRLRILRFPSPPPDQEAVVVYPFVFSAQ